MRVALINQFYPPAQAPTGRLLRDLAETLAARGHAVTVLASAGTYDGESADAAAADGRVTVCRLGPPRPHGTRIGAKAKDFAGFFVRASRTLRGLAPRPDVVICLTTPPFCGRIGFRFQRQFNVPYVLWCMDLYPEALAAGGWLGTRSLPYRALARLACAERTAAAAVVALGPDMAERLARSARGASIEVVPVWSRLEATPDAEAAARALRRRRGWGDAETVLLYSGHIGRAHPADAFVALSERLRAAGARARFVCSGKGPRAEAWRALGGSAWEWIEPVPESVLAAHLLSADIHLVSQHHAWGGVVVPSKYQAACALGRPVLFAGPPESSVGRWIREGATGWHLPPDDAQALDDAARGVTDAARRATRGGRAAAQHRARFDPARLRAQLAQVVEEARDGR